MDSIDSLEAGVELLGTDTTIDNTYEGIRKQRSLTIHWLWLGQTGAAKHQIGRQLVAPGNLASPVHNQLAADFPEQRGLSQWFPRSGNWNILR